MKCDCRPADERTRYSNYQKFNVNTIQTIGKLKGVEDGPKPAGRRETAVVVGRVVSHEPTGTLIGGVVGANS
jgi:hypothetical protein